jgi:hypothetical protein
MKRITFTSRQLRLLPPRTICLGLPDEARHWFGFHEEG